MTVPTVGKRASWLRFSMVLAMAGCLSACSVMQQDDDEALAMAPLPELPESAVKLDKQWSRGVGDQGDEALALALTFPVVGTVYYLGHPDGGAVFAGYVGSLLLAGAYLAVTVATSAMTRNQVISFILSVVICFFLILAGWEPVTSLLVRWAPAGLVELVTGFSVMPHFASFQRGVIDFRDLLFFASVIVFSLFGTSVILRGLRGA
jgi:hypothetical protein